MKNVKRKFIILIVCCVLLIGCRDMQNFEYADESMTLQATVAEFDMSSLRDYMALYQTKLFYMEINDKGANYYMYDFRTSKNKKIAVLSEFAVQGSSFVMIEDKLYFYVGVNEAGSINNVLYRMDFSTEVMETISENSYTKKVIPLTEYNGQLLALQGNILNDGIGYSFIETFTDRGEINEISLKQSNTADASNEDIFVLCIDGSGEYLYTIEKWKVGSDEKYYYIKYNKEFDFLEKVEISHLFAEYGITEALGMFYAFGNCFYIRDFSNNTIVCRLDQENVSVLLCDDVMYVENFSGDVRYACFRRSGTNDIYVLDTQTGEIQIQSYDVGNDSFVIKDDAMIYGNYLLFVKKPLSEDDDREYVYLIPQNFMKKGGENE